MHPMPPLSASELTWGEPLPVAAAEGEETSKLSSGGALLDRCMDPMVEESVTRGRTPSRARG
eukprot:6020857-Amphidinium_carterae.1